MPVVKIIEAFETKPDDTDGVKVRYQHPYDSDISWYIKKKTNEWKKVELSENLKDFLNLLSGVDFTSKRVNVIYTVNNLFVGGKLMEVEDIKKIRGGTLVYIIRWLKPVSKMKPKIKPKPPTKARPSLYFIDEYDDDPQKRANRIRENAKKVAKAKKEKAKSDDGTVSKKSENKLIEKFNKMPIQKSNKPLDEKLDKSSIKKLNKLTEDKLDTSPAQKLNKPLNEKSVKPVIDKSVNKPSTQKSNNLSIKKPNKSPTGKFNKTSLNKIADNKIVAEKPGKQSSTLKNEKSSKNADKPSNKEKMNKDEPLKDQINKKAKKFESKKKKSTEDNEEKKEEP